MNIPSTKNSPALEDFLREFGPSLQRALVARYGFEVGREAAADAPSRVRTLAPSRIDGQSGRISLSGRSIGCASTAPLAAARDAPPRPLTVDSPVDLDLQRALTRLKPEQRIAVLLTCGFGCSHDEVATILGTSTSNVSNHVSRGLTRLRRYVQS